VIYYIAQRRVKNRRDDTGTVGGVPIHRGAFQREIRRVRKVRISKVT